MCLSIIGDCCPPAAECRGLGTGTGDWGLGTGDWGLGTGAVWSVSRVCQVFSAHPPEHPYRARLSKHAPRVPSPEYPVPSTQSRVPSSLFAQSSLLSPAAAGGYILGRRALRLDGHLLIAYHAPQESRANNHASIPSPEPEAQRHSRSCRSLSCGQSTRIRVGAARYRSRRKRP